MMVQSDLTTVEALHLALEMLDTIAQGGSYNKAEYYQNIQRIRRAENRAQAEEILINPADREPLTEYTGELAGSPYSKIIAVAVPGQSDAVYREIEEIMRGDIFHSTLDWQTREQLQDAARLAYTIITANPTGLEN